MFTKRDAQESILTCDSQFLNIVGRDTFYGFLSEHRHEIFPDEDFAFLYCKDNGRPSIAPSLLALGLLLQIYDKVADDEAARRAHFDLQWQVALGVPVGSRPFAKSTLQLFRSQLIIHKKAGDIFKKSLAYAKKVGYLKSRKMKLALDTTPIFGRGAVKDTYNLLSDGIGKLMSALANHDSLELDVWAREHDLSRYLAPSIKGSTNINWDDASERKAFLLGIVADADRLLILARRALKKYPKNSAQAHEITQAAELLSTLLAQDIERSQEGVPALKQGVAKDRIVSVADPEQRHGRKSKSQRFDGHKATIAVDTESQLITAVDVLAGNSHDHTGALDLVSASEQNTGNAVDLTIGDCAYGDGHTRQEFQEASRTLLAKAPRLPHREGKFCKDDFGVDAAGKVVTCPNGVRTRIWTRGPKTARGAYYRNFVFPKNKCRACPLAGQCVNHPGKDRRVFQVHPQENLLRQARHQQRTKRFLRIYKLRQTVEHRIARLAQLGMRQARYIGRAKTLFQLAIAAMIANLTLIASSEAYRLFVAFLLAPLMPFGRFIVLRRLRGSLQRLQHPPCAESSIENLILLTTGGSWPRF